MLFLKSKDDKYIHIEDICIYPIEVGNGLCEKKCKEVIANVTNNQPPCKGSWCVHLSFDEKTGICYTFDEHRKARDLLDWLVTLDIRNTEIKFVDILRRINELMVKG